MNYFGFPITNGYQASGRFYDSVRGHTGVDIGTPSGTGLSLPIGVRVASIKVQSQMGLTLYLEDDQGLILIFAHLSQVLVNVDSVLAPGVAFAKTGNSGSATTGPHLHFEVIGSLAEAGQEHMKRNVGGFSGYNHDPIPYLDGLKAIETKPDEPHWAEADFEWMKERGYISGTHDLDEAVTWAELSTVLRRMSVE
jgi:murein DD-endopeptidase MepM/ murein hydrolase activator NlpD